MKLGHTHEALVHTQQGPEEVMMDGRVAMHLSGHAPGPMQMARNKKLQLEFELNSIKTQVRLH